MYWELLKNNSFGEEWANELVTWNNKLSRIPNSYGNFFAPLILSILYNWYNEENIDTVIKIFKQIERHNFVVYLVSSHNSNKNRAFFYRKANETYRNKSHFFTLSKDYGDIAAQTNNCLEFETFRNEINVRNQNHFLDWIGIKYFLFEYEVSLNPLIHNYDKLTVTPIFSFGKGCNWGIEFNQTRTGANIGPDNKNKLRCSLGNLVICEKRNDNNYNATFQQRCSFQLGHNRFVGLAHGLQNEKEIIKLPYWYPSSIGTRGYQLLDFMNERWQMNISQNLFAPLLFPLMKIENFY